MKKSCYFYHALTQIQMHICSHLIVTAAAGMQLPAYRTNLFDQIFLNIHMDIFIPDGEFNFTAADLVQNQMKAFLNPVYIFRRQDAAFPQHGHMRQTSLNIFLGQCFIKTDRSSIFFYQTIRLLRKTASPQLAH
ncbi:hypothetical protein D3C72_1396130 [compost metagenome]